MKIRIIAICLLVLIFSCKKENDSFISKYLAICDTWETKTITYDSFGIELVKSTRFDRLIINKNLTYTLFMDSVNPIENGNIKIYTQTKNELELFFAAAYPSYSSYAGSHLFGISSLKLISLTDHELILKSTDIEFYPSPAIRFAK